jgi:hypothetical protein
MFWLWKPFLYDFVYSLKVAFIAETCCWWLTLYLLTWRIWWAQNNAIKWQMGFNSAFKGLILWSSTLWICVFVISVVRSPSWGAADVTQSHDVERATLSIWLNERRRISWKSAWIVRFQYGLLLLDLVTPIGIAGFDLTFYIADKKVAVCSFFFMVVIRKIKCVLEYETRGHRKRHC